MKSRSIACMQLVDNLLIMHAKEFKVDLVLKAMIERISKKT